MVNPTKVIDDEYFSSRSKLNEQTGCIEWTRHINQSGYGTLKYRRKNQMAHRFMWEYKNGPIPSGMVICHTCDNRKCINPDHLFIGTTQDNVDDKMQKGRFEAKKGEESGAAKLTTEQIKAIRSDERPQHIIAKDYGVSQSNISFIKLGIGWAHVDYMPERKKLNQKQFCELLGVEYQSRYRHRFRERGIRNTLTSWGMTP